MNVITTEPVDAFMRSSTTEEMRVCSGVSGHVPTIAALRALPVGHFVTGAVMTADGYHALGDGGGGRFCFDATTGAVDNGGTVIRPATGAGAWLRMVAGPLNVRWFGAKGDSPVTDDTLAIQATVDAVPDTGGMVITPCGNFKITAPIRLKSCLRFVGEERLSSKITNHANTSAFVATSPIAGGDGSRLIYLADLYIADALTDVERTAGCGIEISGEGVPPAYDLAIAMIERVTIDRHWDGIKLTQAITTVIRDVRVTSARHDGFSVYPTSTSVTFENTYANACARYGYYLYGAQYSTLQSTASDGNMVGAYCLQSCVGVTMVSCGTESGTGHGIHCIDGFGIVITGVKMEGLPSDTMQDGIVFEGTLRAVVIGGDIRNIKGYGVRCLASAWPQTPLEIDLRAVNFYNCALGICDDPIGAIKLATLGNVVVGPGGGVPSRLRLTEWSSHWLDVGFADAKGGPYIQGVTNNVPSALNLSPDGGGITVSGDIASGKYTVGGKVRISSYSSDWVEVGYSGNAPYLGAYVQGAMTSAGGAFLNLNPEGGTVRVHAAAAGFASLNIPPGAAPTAPVNGDIWNDGTHLYCRIGGVTKQLDN